MIAAYAPNVSFRPVGFYAPLKFAVRRPAQKLIDSLRGESRALLRYAKPIVVNHERANLSPSSEWYRTKEFEQSPKPTVTATAKAPALAGGKGGSGGGSAFKSAMLALLQPSAPSPSRPNEALGGLPNEKRYAYG